MEYAILLGAMGIVIAVKAFTAMALNKEETDLKRAKTDDRELSSKLSALGATERQLAREKKDAEEQLRQIEEEKDRLLVAVQKFGATPVDEPTDEEVFGYRKHTGSATGAVLPPQRRPKPRLRTEARWKRTRRLERIWIRMTVSRLGRQMRTPGRRNPTTAMAKCRLPSQRELPQRRAPLRRLRPEGPWRRPERKMTRDRVF